MIKFPRHLLAASRFMILALVAASLTACGESKAPVGDTSGKPLNVLFILSDDQAPDTIAAHGNQAISTPALDGLAETGTSFRYVFSQGSWSGAVCAPSRRMINTGRHLFHTGMDPRKDQQQDYPVMGETFRGAGSQGSAAGLPGHG
jgi:hypothetical protein